MNGVGFAIAVVAMLLTLSSLTLDDIWIFDVLASLRVQAVIGSAVLAALALVLRRWYAGGLLVCCMLINAGLMTVPMMRAGPMAEPAPPHRMSMLFYNSAQNTLNLFPLRGFVKEKRPDLLAFTEVHAWNIENLREAFPEYRHTVGEPGVFGAVILSRVPINDFRVHRHGPGPSGRTLEVRMCAPLNSEACVALLVLHPTPPIGGDFHAFRNMHLLAAADHARAIMNEHSIAGRVIMAGDFNVTPWNSVYLEALERGDLFDAFADAQPHSTWFSSSIVLGLPIDHVWTGPGVLSQSTAIGPLSGSDHLPIYVEMSLDADLRL